MELDELVAYTEIQRALVTYCRGVDRGDAALIRAAFHPDAIDQHGPYTGPGWELADMLAYRPEEEPEAGGHHEILNVYIDLDGPDTARVESYVNAHHPVRDEQGEDKMLIFAGRYLDRFERRDGEWKIADRRVICDWHEYTPLADPMPGYPPGRKGPSDPSYEMFPPVPT